MQNPVASRDGPPLVSLKSIQSSDQKPQGALVWQGFSVDVKNCLFPFFHQHYAFNKACLAQDPSLVLAGNGRKFFLRCLYSPERFIRPNVGSGVSDPHEINPSLGELPAKVQAVWVRSLSGNLGIKFFDGRRGYLVMRNGPR